MIARWFDGEISWCEIHCGCCGLFFVVQVGGSCFCGACLSGVHPNCKMKEIIGVKA